MKHANCDHDHRHSPLTQFDQFGAIAGLLCALHCALLPLFVGLLPSLGLEFFGTHAFDFWMVCFLGVFALLVISLGYAVDRARLVWSLILGGLAVMGVGLLPGLWAWAHALLLAIGGMSVALGHWLNRRAIATGSPVSHLIRLRSLID